MTALDAVPRPITPGAEMAALLRFHCDIAWTGSISAGGMGPGTPAMTAEGSGTHTTIQDGRWVVGDYRQEQYLLDGTHVLTWQLQNTPTFDIENPEIRTYPILFEGATVADARRGDSVRPVPGLRTP